MATGRITKVRDTGKAITMTLTLIFEVDVCGYNNNAYNLLYII